MTDTTTINSRANHWAHPRLAPSTQAIPASQSLGRYLFLHDSGVSEELIPEDIFIWAPQPDAETGPDISAYHRWLESTEAPNFWLATHGEVNIAEPATHAVSLYLLQLGGTLHSETTSPHIQRISPLNADAPLLANATGRPPYPHLIADNSQPESTVSKPTPEPSSDVPVNSSVAITEEEAPNNSYTAENKGAMSHWVNRWLIISSIIAGIGIALIYIGTSVDTSMVILTGLVMFTAGVLGWTVPFFVLSHWLIEDVRGFLRRRSARR